jgi:SAM-dependent methyltransferase
VVDAQARVKAERDALIRKHGEWIYDIPLSEGVWTRESEQPLPHTRMRRIVQTIADLVVKPLSECRILDLGCLEGLFTLELARQGANVVGVDARRGHIDKAEFAKAQMGLDRATFQVDDVRNVSAQTYGQFDAIVCSGLLYHLPAQDGAELLRTLHEMARLLVIDTHISLAPQESFTFLGDTYHGESYREHAKGDVDEVMEHRPLASYGNEFSYLFSRPSLVNLLAAVGFTSCYECMLPIHLNYGRPGLEHADRCTFVAVKGHPVTIATAPSVNALNERWSEGMLSYGPPISESSSRPLRVLRRLRSRRASA